MKVGALVLAAGHSRRMGAAKLALELDGVPMIAATCARVAAAGLPLLLVTGAHEAVVLKAAGQVPHVHAAAHSLGLSESLKAGLAAAPADWGAALVVLGDMPLVSEATLRLLADALLAGAPAVVPVSGGQRGNPCGIARAHWQGLMQLTGDQGARRLQDGIGVVEVNVDDPGIHRDFDTPADFSAPAPPSVR